MTIAQRKTLLVFLVSVAIAVPLMAVVSLNVDSELFKTILISALGWFAGGAIVGTYIYYRN